VIMTLPGLVLVPVPSFLEYADGSANSPALGWRLTTNLPTKPFSSGANSGCAPTAFVIIVTAKSHKSPLASDPT